MRGNPMLETTTLKLGFLPLLDSAPLIIARERGFFADEGLDVILVREHSWANIRDRVSWGLLDGASMLAPLPLAASLGLAAPAVPMLTGLVLSRHGNAITLSEPLCQRLESYQLPLGEALRLAIREEQLSLHLATVYPYSCHHYQLRSWLEQHQLEPDNDLCFSAVPPNRMLEKMEAGELDGYCVGEPWNSLAEQRGSGRIVATGEQIWPNFCEKVFAVTRSWAERNPNSHLALLRALKRACDWLGQPAHRAEALELLTLPPYLDRLAGLLEPERILPLMPQFHLNNRPDPADAAFLLRQMQQCRQWSGDDIEQVAAEGFRPDLYDRIASGN
ncbi:CmpA/NrtA family ABC transporter substrate-binding protein [Marinobacterium arenosum]|uniref:CmpA/NrtA family ABC transporter substrate-binding protein n=1 Tax=Marinobacterium arenosum TaxID=2862496 RepID=UPI001C96F629|nr:CmpA/NrtA family ABC transporter substrate-binding protein [Marinobacterium arenosum]MBY4678475.1 ABC transporter substrate-binding protein [Marinobacterium arenosum]